MQCYIKPWQISLNHNYVMTFTISPWMLVFSTRNINMVLEVGAVSHASPIVTSCGATGIVASHCPLSTDAVLMTRYLTPLISIFKSVKKNSFTIKHIHKWRILTFTRWIWKCYNCDSDWSVGACCYNVLGFVGTVDSCLHALSCIVTTNTSRTGLHPLIDTLNTKKYE